LPRAKATARFCAKNRCHFSVANFSQK
jgi:hypothetical protein